jgi:tetratricopeptide (TPR) repeat protein
MLRTDEEVGVFDLLVDAGLNLQQAGFPEIAIEALKKAEEINADSAALQLMLGRACHEAGRAAEAEGHFWRVMDLRPDAADAAEALFFMLPDEGGEEAFGFLKELSTAYPADRGVVLGIAIVLLDLDNPHEASRILSRAWEETQDPELGEFLGYVLRFQNLHSEADDVYMQVAHQSQDPEVLMGLLLLLDNSEREDTAALMRDMAAVLERIVTLDPNNAEAWDWLPFIYHQLGRSGDALNAATKASESAPHTASYWLALTSRLLDAGLVTGALNSAEAGLKSIEEGDFRAEKLRAELLELKAKALTRVARFEQALRIVDEALALDPSDADYRQFRSKLEEAMSQLEEE